MNNYEGSYVRDVIFGGQDFEKRMGFGSMRGFSNLGSGGRSRGNPWNNGLVWNYNK